MTGCVREQLLALVLAARNDVREARIDLGASPPPIARAPDPIQTQSPAAQSVLRVAVVQQRRA